VTIARHFGLAAPPAMAPRWNVAPRQPVAAVRRREPGVPPELVPLEWGLKPRWTRAGDSGPRPINARTETVRDMPLFREAFRLRRCLVPADGYYEWQALAGGKQAWFIAAAEPGLLALAGLWELWLSPEGAPLETLAILTTAAARSLAAIHERMPVVIPVHGFDTWLAGDGAAAAALLAALPPPQLVARRISTRVNNPRNEGPELLSA
jgi:putative SOS response-associated peptidase YedK